jgi:hypothetical protein
VAAAVGCGALVACGALVGAAIVGGVTVAPVQEPMAKATSATIAMSKSG